MNSEQGVYKLPICGTTKIIGVGIIGNINLLLFLYYHHPNLDNIYIDMYSNGNCIVYDKDYGENEKIKNPFEYYFEPKFTLKNEMKIIDFPNNHWSLPFFQYGNINLQYKEIYKKIKEKFFNDYRIKNDTLLFVNNFYETHFKEKRVLGVHIRTTDMMATNHNQPKFNYFITKIKEILLDNQIDKIFIASDNNECIKNLIEIFNDKEIIYIENIERVNSFNDIRGSHDRINTEGEIYNNRKYHNYLCGKEAIQDVLLLAKCNYLLKSYSSLSDAAIILNENIEKVY